MSNAAPHAPHLTTPHLTSCTWLVCVFCRASIVNSALVGYFMEGLAIQEHFVAMRRFLLLEDGEFGHVLASALFEAVSSPSAVVRLSSAAFLNPLLTTALQSSIYGDTPHSSRLEFALKYQPAVVKANCEWVWLASSWRWLPYSPGAGSSPPPPPAVHALDFLELHYSVEWPCNVVITAGTIAKSNQILHFLLQLKRASWALQDVFAHLKKREHTLTSPWGLPLCLPSLSNSCREPSQ